jgi:aspartate aminotransferase
MMPGPPARLARRVRELAPSATLAVSDLAARLRAEGRDILDFSAGQPDFPSPTAVKQAGCRAIEEDRTRYTATPGVQELRQAVAERFHEKRGLRYEPSQVLVSPGAKASLYFACQTLFEDGDEVLVPTPYWTSYPEQVRLTGAEPVFVDCPESGGFKLSADQVERAVTPRSKGLILNYPSNPTGVCYSGDELSALAEVAVRHGLWVLADEIYSELIYDGRRFESIARQGSEIAARTIVVDGLSKTYAMTGWRIGYAAGPAEVISGMTRLQSQSTSNATSISQWAGVEALHLTADELQPRVDEFGRRRDEVLKRLEEIPGVECVRPQGAFYVLPNVSGCFNETITSGGSCATYLLEHAGVAVVPGEAFGSPDHVRLSYAASMESIREGMDRMAEALGALTVR